MVNNCCYRFKNHCHLFIIAISKSQSHHYLSFIRKSMFTSSCTFTVCPSSSFCHSLYINTFILIHGDHKFKISFPCCRFASIDNFSIKSVVLYICTQSPDRYPVPLVLSALSSPNSQLLSKR